MKVYTEGFIKELRLALLSPDATVTVNNGYTTKRLTVNDFAGVVIALSLGHDIKIAYKPKPLVIYGVIANGWSETFEERRDAEIEAQMQGGYVVEVTYDTETRTGMVRPLEEATS